VCYDAGVSLAATKRATYAEYLALEGASDVKHEYIAGAIVAMSGGTIEHARLIGRIAALLSRALEGRPCVVLPSDARVRIRAADRAIYPDLHIVCGAIQRDDEDANAVVNPIVVAEVLSDSTAESDRGDRFAAYRRLRSLREYVLVSQHERRVDVYRRDGRRWILDDHGSGERLRLESVEVELAVDDVYTDALGTVVN
jgi:Uma2 family endonuclease